MHDTEPQKVTQADFVEPMVPPGLIIGRPHLSVQRKVPAQNDAALIRIVGMRALRERSPRDVIHQKTRFGRVGLPSELVTEDEGMHWFYVLRHGANLSRLGSASRREEGTVTCWENFKWRGEVPLHEREQAFFAVPRNGASVMAVAKTGRRSSVLGDRLWDSQGQVWTGTLGSWATAADVASLLASGAPVVVHGFDRPFRDLTVADARAYWQRVREHFHVQGDTTAAPDHDGLTYAARVWRTDDKRLLGFVEFC